VITAITFAPAPMRQLCWIEYRGGLTRIACEVFDIEIYLAVFDAGFRRAAVERCAFSRMNWRGPP